MQMDYFPSRDMSIFFSEVSIGKANLVFVQY